MINREEYHDLKKTYSRRRTEAEAQAEAIQEEMGREIANEDRSWMEQFRRRRNITALERSIVVTLIERILIFRDHRVEIVYRWHNEFRSQMDLLLLAQKLTSGKEAV